MKKLKVDVHLNTRAGLNTVSDVAPEAIIVATGAGPGLRFCPFKGSPTTFDLFSAMDRPDEDWEERAVVIGGDSKSCAAALYIAGRGAEVHVVEPRAEFAYDKLSPGKDRLIGTLVDLPTVHLRAESTVEEVGEGYVVIQSHGRSERLSGIGSVVVGGRTPNNGLYEEILQHGPEMEVYNIGDSVRPRDVYHATHEAADVAETIRLRAAAGT
jgi:2-enoate reductase